MIKKKGKELNEHGRLVAMGSMVLSLQSAVFNYAKHKAAY